MLGENAFYTWTIVEAWNWASGLPVLGFALLVFIPVCVLVRVIITMAQLGMFSE